MEKKDGLLDRKELLKKYFWEKNVVPGGPTNPQGLFFCENCSDVIIYQDFSKHLTHKFKEIQKPSWTAVLRAVQAKKAAGIAIWPWFKEDTPEYTEELILAVILEASREEGVPDVIVQEMKKSDIPETKGIAELSEKLEDLSRVILGGRIPMPVVRKSEKIINVVVGIPNWGKTECESYFNRLLLVHRLGMIEALSAEGKLVEYGIDLRDSKNTEFKFHYANAGRMLTQAARERIFDVAMNQVGADYIFMIDDDMTTPQNLFEKLYRHDVDIVAPLAFTRNPDHLAVMYEIPEDDWDMFLKRGTPARGRYVRNWPKDALVECDAVGFGAVLINTRILKRMTPPYCMTTSPTGEDIFFCSKSRKEAGARVYMDTSVKLGHLGAPVIIDEEYASTFNKHREFIEKLGPWAKEGSEVMLSQKGRP